MSQELRYNLATKVMRNGVEVIVATDKNLRPVEPEYLRHLSSTVTRPITLAPHTVTNLMSMVLPTGNSADGQSHLMSILQPSFITRTYYTAYNYPTTVLKDNTTSVSNIKTTITNAKVEEHSKVTLPENIRPTATQTVTLHSSPNFQTEVFQTTYTYWNTFLDGEQPIVMSSTHTLSNTLVGIFGDDDQLEPSEVFPVTNTYLKTIEFTKMLTDGTDFQIISTKDLVTQVVVTAKPLKKVTNVPITTDVTKTYFVTYTYFSTYVDGDKTKVKSDVSVSSDVTIEKFYIKPKKTETKIIQETSKPELLLTPSFSFSIFATKTYLTTFTYFTTLLQDSKSEKSETKINSRTKVVENTVTETIGLQDFNTDYLLRLNSTLNKITGSLIATATLKGGEKIKVTAYKDSRLSSSHQKYEIEPTKTTSKVKPTETKTEIEAETAKIKSTFSKSSLLLSKTKSNLHKSKIKPMKTSIAEATAEALVAIETDSVAVTPTVTLTPAFATHGITQSAAVSPVTRQPEEVTVSPVEQEVKDQIGDIKKPTVKQPNAPVNVSNLLNLNSLGINGMNVLGPVFNAMAELIHNNLNKNVDSMTRRNDTVAREPEQVLKKPTSSHINPLLSFVNKFTPPTVKGMSEAKVKITTPRTPVYIPVGSFAKDSEFEESQNSEAESRPENWLDKWTDVKKSEKVRPHDTPITILEGGIPISPGQVITTNSDVIIGRPGETGPRPPIFAVKSNIPIDMKPPPLLPHVVFKGTKEEDGFLGQHSTNQEMDFNVEQDEVGISPSRPSLTPAKKYPNEGHKNLRPHSFKLPHHKNQNTGKHTPADYDSGTIDLNPPPAPPPPVRSHDVHRPITINHEQSDESEAYSSPNQILPIPVHLGPNQNVENYINPAEIYPSILGVPALGQTHQDNFQILAEPTQNINPNILLIPTVPHVNLVATGNSNLVDRSTGHQLLVNIQPSQVANIVIPHGSSTALILSDEKQHSLKGEVIDDPSPHQEPETVGFVPAEPVLKIENEDITIHNDVVPAEATAQQSGQANSMLLSNRPHLTTELIKIRPKPDGKGQQNSIAEQNYQHLFIEQQQSSQKPDFSYIENHRPTDNHKTETDLMIYQKGGAHTNQNIQTLNFANEAKKIYQNYRKEGPHYFGLAQDVSNPVEIRQHQQHHKHHNYQQNIASFTEQTKFIQGPSPVRGGNGIYVDISPPGHLPPRPTPNLLHPSHSLNKQQTTINEHLLNHQSGLVHDVPLHAQVQLGTGQKKENPLKEILISSNTNKHDSIYDPKKKPDLKRPLPELPENLSPPPLNKEGNYRIHRPPVKPPHPVTVVQRFPPFPHQPVPKPVDFMMPPPQVSHRPSQKPHPEHHSRPLIPIGAGAQQNYPNPLPEDILIVPHKNRPGSSALNVNTINHKPLGISPDLDVSNEPIKTEYGEEIQESISRPLFPGQLPAELQELNTSYVHNHKNVLRPNSEIKPKDNTTQKVKTKLETGSDGHKENSENLTNISSQWSSGYQHDQHGTSETNDHISGSSASFGQSSFFSLIKKPSGFVTNYKESGFANHKEQTKPTDISKLAGIRIHAIGPSVLPSGFVKNENTITQKHPLNTDTNKNDLPGGPENTSNGNLKIGVKESTGSATSSISSVFGLKNKTAKPNPDSAKLNEQSGTINTSSERPVFDQNKPGKDEGTKFKAGQKRKPIQEPEGFIKFDPTKISTGYPAVSSPGTFTSESGKPQRYPIADVATVKPSKRPTGFTVPKKEDTPISFAVGDSSTTTEKPPVEHVGPAKIPLKSGVKNDTNSFAATSNHGYGNKTIHFYGPQSSVDVNEERDAAYNQAESNVDKWFATNFGDGNINAESNKRNVSSFPNSADSSVHITLLTPPKVGDGRPKLEDVMGLSPPPLERPRRPPAVQRPKPPFKFEIPTTSKSTLPPIAIENDFPPVRSPDFNKKPIKPQDIFPPRLPDNFIHHVPEYPVRNRPKPRPVTSMPLDVPGTSTEKTYDIEENNDRDTYFAGSEINGHSKPILRHEPNLSPMRPPSPPSAPQNNRVKPVVHPKPTIIYQQPPKVRTTERKRPETTTTEQKLPGVTPTQITPTATINPTTFHTKVSTSVTPTAVQSQNNWHYAGIITGSETVFDPEKFSSYVTPSIHDFTSKKNLVTTLVSTGSTTIFGDLYTSGPKQGQESQKPTTAKENPTIKDGALEIAPTRIELPVRTTTLTVTTTMTTVVHSIGHKPSTKTIVLTKTLISTVFNKVTETKTLVKPTTATVIQTHTIATTKTALVVPTALYPTQTKYPAGGTLKPEIFMADPHAKDTMTISVSSSMNKNKHEEDKRKPSDGKDSILVFVSDDQPNIKTSVEENNNFDVINDEDNNINESKVFVGGVFDANNEKEHKEKNKEVECAPGCKARRNESCQRIEGFMKCVCRPGFARMFPDRPCRPTYTYKVQLMLEKFGSEQITQEKNFVQSASPNMAKLASATKEGLDRLIMQSDLRDTYHGIMVNSLQGKDKKTMVDFYVQLSENTDETKLMEILKKTLQASNYSLGGTELFAARESGSLYAEDFNECLNLKFHDCSENARCFNLKGTYTCSCKEGFTDLSENSQFPGRVCSDVIGCEYCDYHGVCYSKGEGQITCECFQWYSGERCHINLKVLLIALVTIGAILLALLLMCVLMTCLSRRSRNSTASRTNGSGYLRYRGPSSQSLDRRAMIADSSSESSVDNLPYICSPHLPSSEVKKKPALRHAKGPAPRPVPPTGMEQRDRSVTVMIPRAKYRPMPPLSPHLTMSTFSPDRHLSKTAAQIATEQKLINYLEGNSREDRTLAGTMQNNRQTKETQKNSEYKTTGGSPKPVEKKKESKVFEYEYKISNMLFTEETNSGDKRSFKSLDDRFRRHSDSAHLNSDVSNRNQFRKYSTGALVSAGYEVSAKVGMHHLEEDTTEDERSAIINTHTMKSNRSQFTTLNRTGDHKTMSEARSYDETTVHPPTRSLKTHYSGSSPSSRVNNDEGHTMIERDLGSTFIMPESQLFKPEADRVRRHFRL